MRIQLLLTIAIAAIISGACSQPVESAAAGAAPAINTPVGPVPGPGLDLKLPVNPYETDPVALTEGRKLFVWYNCAGCHGGHAGGGMGPSLRDVDWIYGNSDAHIFDSIAHGRAHGMPAWGTKLPEEQIWKLAAYVKSLRSEREPEPPPADKNNPSKLRNTPADKEKETR